MIAIVGGGFAGLCVALALAERGVACEILEREGAVFTRAGLNSEGKVHLGYVFAQDTSFETADLMIRSAVVFETLLSRWLGCSLAPFTNPEPFHYLVHRDSLVAPDELEHRYRTIAARIGDAFGAGQPYFGIAPAMAPERLSAANFDAHFDGRAASAAFLTGEAGLDPAALGAVLVRRVAQDPLIRIRTNADVQAITRDVDHVRVSGHDAGGAFAQDYDHVVNCSWESQRKLDQSAGVLEPGVWMNRFKCFVRATPGAMAAMPSTTIVLGGFGDVVRYADGAHFLSWYPASRVAVSFEIAPSWSIALDAENKAQIRDGVLQGLSRLLPAIAAAAPRLSPDNLDVRGGAILAPGATDVDDPQSGLHSRAQTGLRSFGRFHSLNVGKWGSAPYWAMACAQRLTGAS